MTIVFRTFYTVFWDDGLRRRDDAGFHRFPVVHGAVVLDLEQHNSESRHKKMNFSVLSYNVFNIKYLKQTQST
jgi:hypothetical protein